MIKDQRAGGERKSAYQRRKTIRITKQTDFVQRDEFHGAEEPMPNVTFREIKRQKRRLRKRRNVSRKNSSEKKRKKPRSHEAE